MFDIKKYLEPYNQPKEAEYQQEIIRLKEQRGAVQAEPEAVYSDFIEKITRQLLTLVKLEEKLGDAYFEQHTIDELKVENQALYSDIIGENYNRSYANPEKAAAVFGEEIGQTIAYTAASVYGCIRLAYQHRICDMARVFAMVNGVIDVLMNMNADFMALKAVINASALVDLQQRYELRYRMNMDPKNQLWTDVIDNTDLFEPKYLFKFGSYISDNELKLAEYLARRPQADIDSMAATMIDAFFRGIASANKSTEGKSVVTYYYQPGTERIVRAANGLLRKGGLQATCTFDRSAGTSPNRQFDYDHKFDQALYMDEAYVDAVINGHAKAAAAVKDVLNGYAGIIALEAFGEQPFTPKNKKEAPKMSEAQRTAEIRMINTINQEANRYIDRKNYSFVIIAYPLPEIGEQFEAVFDETIKVNTLDSDNYARIQQVMIDELDTGDYVHIKGKGDNKTDIKVKLYALKDPNKETIFENCVAEVNIPVGEVFTSPVLTGTTGTLHIGEIYLQGLKYKNLTLMFKDGWIADYGCDNFKSDEENRAFVRDNLMHAHETLPMGEFAIGTNTTAYMMANRYDIVPLLPILIVEKMGPHFAIGDTCYSWEEDVKIYNRLDGKEIVARDNEKSLNRKQDINNAYTNCHVDITLPYHEIAAIAVIKKDGSTSDIIRDGRFVLAGTEELNIPFGDGSIE